jgi:DNA-binding transcriptional LysR family regulator
VNFRTLDLNLLRVFDVVMTERNVTRAASRLAMTQPAVSNALRRLREATGEDLFIAGSTGVTPTPHADVLWPTVRSALGGLREALDPQTFDPHTARRTFTLAMADANAALTVPRLVDAMQREAASVDLRFVPLTTRDPRQLLEQGQADIAIGFFPDVAAALAAEGAQAAVRLDPLYRCEYVCVMRGDHPLAAPGALTLEAYCAADHLRVSFAGRPRGYVEEALTALGRERRVMVTVNHFHVAGAAVHGSDLLTVLPRSFVPALGFAEELAFRALPFPMPAIDVGLLWHRRHERDDGQRWLRALLTDASMAVAARADRERATEAEASSTDAPPPLRFLRAPATASVASGAAPGQG